MLSRTKDWFVVVSSGALLVLVLVFGYMTVLDGTWPHTIIEFDATLLDTDKTSYAPGDLVMVKQAWVKHRDVPGHVRWSLVNHQVYEFVERCVGVPVGQRDKWLPAQEIPDPWPHAFGTYRFDGVVTYYVNPFRTLVYRIQTKPFEIVTKQKEEN